MLALVPQPLAASFESFHSFVFLRPREAVRASENYRVRRLVRGRPPSLEFLERGSGDAVRARHRLPAEEVARVGELALHHLPHNSWYSRRAIMKAAETQKRRPTGSETTQHLAAYGPKPRKLREIARLVSAIETQIR